MVRLALAVTWAHLAVLVVHAAAHVGLRVFATPAENVFIGVFIYAAPVAAAVLLLRGRTRPGLALLAAAMIGSLAFATHHHFLVISEDHVGHLPEGAWRLPFQITAFLAEPIDALGAVVALWTLARRS